jgi:hypothetical protein
MQNPWAKKKAAELATFKVRENSGRNCPEQKQGSPSGHKRKEPRPGSSRLEAKRVMTMVPLSVEVKRRSCRRVPLIGSNKPKRAPAAGANLSTEAQHTGAKRRPNRVSAPDAAGMEGPFRTYPRLGPYQLGLRLLLEHPPNRQKRFPLEFYIVTHASRHSPNTRRRCSSRIRRLGRIRVRS